MDFEFFRFYIVNIIIPIAIIVVIVLYILKLKKKIEDFRSEYHDLKSRNQQIQSELNKQKVKQKKNLTNDNNKSNISRKDSTAQQTDNINLNVNVNSKFKIKNKENEKKNKDTADKEPKQKYVSSSYKKISKSNKFFCNFFNLKQGVHLKKCDQQTEWFLKNTVNEKQIYKLYHVGNLPNSESWYRIYSKMYNTPESGMELGKTITINCEPLYKLSGNNIYKLIKKGSITFI